MPKISFSRSRASKVQFEDKRVLDPFSSIHMWLLSLARIQRVCDTRSAVSVFEWSCTGRRLPLTDYARLSLSKELIHECRREISVFSRGGERMHGRCSIGEHTTAAICGLAEYNSSFHSRDSIPFLLKRSSTNPSDLLVSNTITATKRCWRLVWMDCSTTGNNQTDCSQRSIIPPTWNFVGPLYTPSLLFQTSIG